MRCRFLSDANVRFCEASAFRKTIAEPATADERCSSADWVSCPAAASRLPGEVDGTRCPFLQDALMQFCAAAPVRKYIPASDALLPRCNSDDHLYCELYLAKADPEGFRLPEPQTGSRRCPTAARPVTVDEIQVPTRLPYTPNHMWLDVAEDGHCHVGIDGFLAHVIGEVEKIGFVTSRTLDRPIAVLTVNGADLQMAFPNPLRTRRRTSTCAPTRQNSRRIRPAPLAVRGNRADAARGSRRGCHAFGPDPGRTQRAGSTPRSCGWESGFALGSRNPAATAAGS